MTQAATMTEQVVAQAISEATDSGGDWGCWLPEARAAIAALQGSAALPSEAGDRLGPSELYGAVGVAMFKADLGGLRIDHKINFVGNAAYTAMRAAAPTANPVQDDDAEDRSCPLCNGDCAGANPPVLDCPMKRLSPTPDTGLIEAHRDDVIAAYKQGALDVHEAWVEGCGEENAPSRDPDFTEAAHDYADTALANAAPAQK